LHNIVFHRIAYRWSFQPQECRIRSLHATLIDGGKRLVAFSTNAAIAALISIDPAEDREKCSTKVP